MNENCRKTMGTTMFCFLWRSVVAITTFHARVMKLFAGGLFVKRSKWVGQHNGKMKFPVPWEERGVALILVLLMVAIIVAITIQLNRSMRCEVYEAANLGDGIRMRYVAESGIYAGEALLLIDKNTFDALTENWARAEMLALKYEDIFDNASFRLFIENEGGKIPISFLNSSVSGAIIRGVLERLLTGPYFHLSPDHANAIIDAVKDWMDGDNDVTGNGAEEGYYASLQKPYEIKNAALDCIEELLMVKGVTRELFYGKDGSIGLTDCVTIFGEGIVNINTAPKPVLRALSDAMTEDLVDQLDEYRRDGDHDLGEAAWYKKILGEEIASSIPSTLVSLRSDYFRIRAIGQRGTMVKQITAVVQRESGKTKTLSWKVD